MSGQPSRAIAPALGFALFVAIVAAAFAQPAYVRVHAVPGEKIDSGLGDLPPYSDWSTDPYLRTLVVRPNAVPGEKLDSGLGELKHYRFWADSTGRLRERNDLASRR